MVRCWAFPKPSGAWAKNELSSGAWSAIIVDICRECELDEDEFATHSFRRGFATFLHQRGVLAHDIQAYGVWRSEAYRLYILHLPLQVLEVLRRAEAGKRAAQD